MVPISPMAEAIELFAGKDGCPYPDCSTSPIEYITREQYEAELQNPPSLEELQRDPNIAAVLAAVALLPK